MDLIDLHRDHLERAAFSAPVPVTNATPFARPDGAYLKIVASFTRSSQGESAQLSDVTVATLDRPLSIKPNKAPVVHAGTAVTVTLPAAGHLIGSVCDDGLPKGVLAPMWSKVSGPGTVTFATPGREVTDVFFELEGSYVLRLSGMDTDQTATSDLTVTVLRANLAPIVTAVTAPASGSVTQPNAVTLTGTARDDGLPAGGSLVTTWSYVSGPGTVAFAAPGALTTTATFSDAGVYGLRFSAYDGMLRTSADVSVTVHAPAPVNQPPIVRAGHNITVQLGGVANLTGLVTDDGLPAGAPVTQRWSQVSGPGTSAFADATAALTTATLDAVGTYVLRLTASDTALTGFSEVAVVVLAAPPPLAPPLANAPPVVSAGPNLAVNSPTTSITLAGSVTDDGLPVGGTLTSTWSVVSGPGAVTFANASAASTTATLAAEGTYILRLSATDTQFTVSVDIQVDRLPATTGDAGDAGTAIAAANHSPVVAAGGNLTIHLGDVAPLAGTVTDDGLPSGSTVTQLWSQTSGPGATAFGTPSAASTTATFSLAGTYILRLTASDTVLSGYAEMAVVVLPPASVVVDLPPVANTPPIAGAGPNLAVNLPANTVTLRGTVTDDGLPTGTLTSRWTLVTGPGAVTFGDATLATTTATLTAPGTYTLRLTATDTQFSVGADVQVVVAPAVAGNTAPVVNAGIGQTLTLPTQTTTLAATVTDDGNPAGSVVSVQWSVASGPASVVFGSSTSKTTTATFGTPGVYVLRCGASDTQLTGSGDVVVTVVAAPAANLAPVVVVGPPITVSFPATTQATLVATVTDDGLPLGSTLQTQWLQESGPDVAGGGQLAASLVGNVATFSGVGAYTFRLWAFDGQLTSSGLARVTVVQPELPNTPPVVRAGLAQTITLPASATLSGAVRDDGLPAASTLTMAWTQVSGPGTATFAFPASAATAVRFDQPGAYTLRLTANDGALAASADVTVTVLPMNHAPVVSAGVAQVLAYPATSAVLAGVVTDDGLPSGGALTTLWTTVSGPELAVVDQPTLAATTVHFTAPGAYVLRLTANDSDKSASADVAITVGAPAGGLPVVALAATLDGSAVTKPTPIVGSVSGGAWTVDVALGDDESAALSDWRTIASGTSLVVNGTVATLDPTVLLNGTYSVRLTATTASGSATATAAVRIDKNMKVGTFALAFDDLSVAALGFPITVQRTYDNKDKRVGDFGVGWTLGVKNVRVEKSVSLGKYWYEFQNNSGLFPEYTLTPQRDPFVTVTFPSGKSYKFEMQASPNDGYFPITFADVTFQPIAGTVGQLYATNGSALTVQAGAFGLYGPVKLLTTSLEVFNPTRFTFVDEDGITYVINQKNGIEQITDLDGNTLSIGTDGLTHSCGKHVDFVRDSQGRITSIVDANGKSMAYSYDALGNLAAFTNREGDQQQYAYDAQHNLTAATDGRGITPANYSYDAQGRLVAVKDAYTHETNFVHDTATNTDIVTDALGGVTTYQYDNDGNVVTKVDANGKTWLSSFDANDNMLSETDPLGNTTHHEYDALNNKTADVDALGKRTTYTWGNNRRMTSMTDPLGRKTVDTWDYYWSRKLEHQDPIQVAGGLPGTRYRHEQSIFTNDTTTDALGHSSQVHYDESGRMDATTDAMGHVVSYGYDANGNTTLKSETRTKADLTIETLVTSWEYDKQGRVTKTTYPDHSTTSTQYNKFGKPSKTIDQLLRETNYVYDSLGRLIETDFPDGYNEQTAYDANGRRGASTDKAGRITTYGYDAVGRMIRTTYPDGTGTQTAYDEAGRAVAQSNENGHTTGFGYDASGRRVSVTDALGNTSSTVYDGSGQVSSVVDPLGHEMSYTYDLDGRQTRMTYADGTHTDTVFDADGNRTQSIDQALVATTFGYDANDRLTSVRDALGGITSYGYDELGQKTSQTDANLHTTRYAYDVMGRRVSRSLPMGQTELMAYDSGGELTAKTDFGGKTTAFSYDIDHRPIPRSADPSFRETDVTWNYLPTGRRLSMSDSTGVTSYAYDRRERLLSKATPEGTLFYTRDSAGHVVATRSDAADGVAVDYAWDADERLASVTDRGPGSGAAGFVTNYSYDTAGRPLGWVQPNGVATSFTYDADNRLTSETINKADGSSINSYAYSLSPTGNRTGVAEGSGRSIVWAYDTLYRLTGETISGSASANGVVGYTYDSVGNRLSRTSTLTGVAPSTATYDADDRVGGESFNQNGDQTTREGRSQSFDSQDRLVGASGSGVPTVSVAYDGDGNRVSETVDGVTVKYLVDDQNPTALPQVVEQRANGLAATVWVFGRKMVSTRRLSGASWSRLYFEIDGHGSVVFLTSDSALTLGSWEYDAFGMVIAASTPTDSEPLLYSGEWMNTALGLQFLRSRWYAAGGGRYISGDTDETSDGFYRYVRNRPTMGVDPLGHDGDLSSELALVAASFNDLSATNGSPGGPSGAGASGSLDLYIRSFAPWDTFGGGFEGDSRGFSTSLFVTSRISAHVTFKVPNMTITAQEIHSDPSHHWLLGTATESPTLYVDGSGPHFIVSYEGANPLVKGAPNIDVLADFTAEYQSPIGICFAGDVRGDGFPDTEIFAHWDHGSKMIFTYGVEDTWWESVTGPRVLVGTGRSPMGSFNECVGWP